MTEIQSRTYEMGKTPARKGAISFRFKRYVDLSTTPDAPDTFGNANAVVSHWGLFANERHQTAVFAAFAHEEMLRARVNGDPVEFTDWHVIDDYSAISGFDYDESKDLGVDLAAASAFRRKVGIADYSGTRHKVAGYAALKARKTDELAIAVNLFGSVGIGLEISSRAINQFKAGEVWDVTRRGRVVGTTFAPVVGRNAAGNFEVVIWGRIQEMTPEFYRKYNDESVVYFTEGMVNGETPVAGFKSHLLLKDLRRLHPSEDERE